jgi:hypothetical protein
LPIYRERGKRLRTLATEGIRLKEQIAARELVSSPLIDRNRIVLVARLELEGRKEAHEMVDGVYPPGPSFASLSGREQKLDRVRRKDNLKKFRRNNRSRIDLEKERQMAKPDSTSIAS